MHLGDGCRVLKKCEIITIMDLNRISYRQLSLGSIDLFTF